MPTIPHGHKLPPISHIKKPINVVRKTKNKGQVLPSANELKEQAPCEVTSHTPKLQTHDPLFSDIESKEQAPCEIISHSEKPVVYIVDLEHPKVILKQKPTAAQALRTQDNLKALLLFSIVFTTASLSVHANKKSVLPIIFSIYLMSLWGAHGAHFLANNSSEKGSKNAQTLALGIKAALNPIDFVATQALNLLDIHSTPSNDTPRHSGLTCLDTLLTLSSGRITFKLITMLCLLSQKTPTQPPFKENPCSFNSSTNSPINASLLYGSLFSGSQRCRTLNTNDWGLSPTEDGFSCDVSLTPTHWNFLCTNQMEAVKISCLSPQITPSESGVGTFQLSDPHLLKAKNSDEFMEMLTLLSRAQPSAQSHETLSSLHKVITDLQKTLYKDSSFRSNFSRLNTTDQKDYLSRWHQRLFSSDPNEGVALQELTYETNKLLFPLLKTAFNNRIPMHIGAFGKNNKPIALGIPSPDSTTLGRFGHGLQGAINMISWRMLVTRTNYHQTEENIHEFLKTLIHEGSHARQLSCGSNPNILTTAQSMKNAAQTIEAYKQNGRLSENVLTFISEYHPNNIETAAEYESHFHLNGHYDFKSTQEFNRHNDRIIDTFKGDPEVEQTLYEFQEAYTDLLRQLENKYPMDERLAFKRIDATVKELLGPPPASNLERFRDFMI